MILVYCPLYSEGYAGLQNRRTMFYLIPSLTHSPQGQCTLQRNPSPLHTFRFRVISISICNVLYVPSARPDVTIKYVTALLGYPTRLFVGILALSSVNGLNT